MGSSSEETQRETWRIWKNVTLVSLSYMLFYSALGLVFSLQSTINSNEGLGNTSHAVIYVAQIFSSMFVPTLMISKLRLKWTMIISQFGYSSFIIAQFYPSFSTLIPAAIIVGFASAPLWSAKSTYLSQVGARYAVLTGRKDAVESSISRIFSVYAVIFQTSSIWGNLIGSLVLSAGLKKNSKVLDIPISSCGANFCYDNHPANLSTTSYVHSEQPANVPLLMSILLALAIQATLILVIFVDGNPTSVPSEAVSRSSRSAWKMLIATFRHLRNPNQILIIPFTLWTGFEGAFFSADFTYAYITCAFGAEKIGFVLTYFGIGAAITSLLFGYLVERVGRAPFFLLSAGISFALLLILQFHWHPDPNYPGAFYLVSALWGASQAIITIGLNSFYGFVFASNKEAAFSNYRLWQSIGYAIPLAYANYLCIRTKLFILMGILICAVMGFMAIEIRERKSNYANNSPNSNRTKILEST